MHFFPVEEVILSRKVRVIVRATELFLTSTLIKPACSISLNNIIVIITTALKQIPSSMIKSATLPIVHVSVVCSKNARILETFGNSMFFVPATPQHIAQIWIYLQFFLKCTITSHFLINQTECNLF